MMKSIKIGGALIAAAIVSGQTQTGPGASGQPAAVPGGQGGIVVYIDPQTGAIRPDPAPGTVPLQLSPWETNANRTDHEGLVEVPNPVPGGGVKLDLQGRFQSPLMGTIDANGKARVQRLPAMPKSDGNK